ncbi:MAG: TonB-dependent receptor [Bacteroidetes bacterium]|nr:TonB-dependent receptor [Bacteroidota bacterium]
MSIRILSILATFIIISVTPSWSHAQLISITGTVSDVETRLPLFGASVLHVNSGQGVSSDEEGYYSLEGLPAGKNLIRVSFTGYKNFEIEIDHSGEEVYQLDIELISGVDLDQLQVTASRRQEKILDTPASIDVLLAEDISHLVVPSTVMALKNVTGIDIAQTGIDRNEVALRGFNDTFSGATYIMTDYRDTGVPAVNLNIHSMMPNISVDIDRIEIVRGPGSALYGPGVDSGVIHYITKDAFTHPGVTIALSGGEQSQLNVQTRIAEVISNRIGVKVTGAYSSAKDFALQSCESSLLMAQQFSQCPDEADAVQIFVDGERDTEFYKYVVTGNLDFRAGKNTTLSLNGGVSGLKGALLSGVGTVQAQNYGSAYAQARLSSGSFFAQVYLNQANSGDSYVYGGAPVVDHSSELSMQAQYDINLGDRQGLIVGADVELTRPDTRGTVLGRNEFSDGINEYGLYAQSTTKLTNRLELTLALRGDYNNVQDKIQISPRFGLVMKPALNSSFRLTYNRSYSSPSATTNWVDLVVASLPGDLNVRARGSANTFNFARNPNYLKLGATTDLVASSLIPAFLGSPTPVGISTGIIYDFMYQGLAAIPDEELGDQLRSVGLDVPPALIGLLKAALSPESIVVDGFSPGVLGSLNLSTLQIETGLSDLEDLNPAQSTISQVIELGYKGIINENVLFAIDAYYSTRKNFLGGLQVRTPFVLVPTLTQDLARDISNGITNNTIITNALGLFGLTPEEAGQLLVDVAGTALPGPTTPIAIVQPNENNPGEGKSPEIMLSYPNFGSVAYFGADVSVQAILSPALTVFTNVSWISDNYFDHIELGEEQEDRELSMNAPTIKVKFGGQYNLESGFSINASGRYIDGFPVISGQYRGDVPSYLIMDIGAGYGINSSLRVDLGINNALDSNHREFVGAPKLGRTATARLTYTTGW